MTVISVLDPHSFNPDPDPGFFFNGSAYYDRALLGHRKSIKFADLYCPSKLLDAELVVFVDFMNACFLLFSSISSELVIHTYWYW